MSRRTLFGNRRSAIVQAACRWTLVCLISFVGFCIQIPAHAEQPNVLFIAVDDLRCDLGCLGNRTVLSPNMDRLAQRGTLFTRAYCQQAVCNPSRASLLTGLRPSTLGIWDLPTHFRDRFPDLVTLPQHFKNNGYYTENIGKIFHNWRQDTYKGDAPSWSIPAVLHYASHGADKAIVKGPIPPDTAKTPKCEIRDVPDEAYYDGRVAQRAVDAIGRLKESKEPFFLAVGFWKPHAHFNAPKKYWDLYDRNAITAAENSEPPRDVPQIALHDGREIRRSFKSRPDSTPTAEDAVALRHGYYAAISYADAQIGKVLNALNDAGLADNTVIVLWSDHGFHLGEHGLWAKTSNFELDARVPLMIAAPGFPAGQRCSSLVELLDLYPTLVDLCDLPAPRLPEKLDQVEGKSLKPLLNDPSRAVKKAAFTWHPRPAYPAAGASPDAMGFSIRTADYRYTEWRDFRTNQLVARELYDHRSDPGENRNTADLEKNRDVVEKLHSMMAQNWPWSPPAKDER